MSITIKPGTAIKSIAALIFVLGRNGRREARAFGG
jgi:hypothetical protein